MLQIVPARRSIVQKSTLVMPLPISALAFVVINDVAKADPNNGLLFSLTIMAAVIVAFVMIRFYLGDRHIISTAYRLLRQRSFGSHSRRLVRDSIAVIASVVSVSLMAVNTGVTVRFILAYVALHLINIIWLHFFNRELTRFLAEAISTGAPRIGLPDQREILRTKETAEFWNGNNMCFLFIFAVVWYVGEGMGFGPEALRLTTLALMLVHSITDLTLQWDVYESEIDQLATGTGSQT